MMTGLEFGNLLLNETAAREEIIKNLSLLPNNLQNVSTPKSICKKMLSLIPDFSNKKVVILFNIEFLEEIFHGEIRLNVTSNDVLFIADNKLEGEFASKIYNVNSVTLSKNDDVTNLKEIFKKINTYMFSLWNNIEYDRNKIMPKFSDKNNIVVIMNPPYQNEQNVPLYNKFLEIIIDDINPDTLVSIHPSRYMVGGRGLEKFRNRLLNDKRIEQITDYQEHEKIFKNVSISGGVQILKWSKNYEGLCLFNNKERCLNEYDIFIRDVSYLSILEKVLKNSKHFIGNKVSSRKPFGIESNFSKWCDKNESDAILCYKANKKEDFVKKTLIIDRFGVLNKWKVALAFLRTEGATHKSSQYRLLKIPFIIEPNAICSETYIIINSFDNKIEAENFISYINTKFFRFMVFLRTTSQNITKNCYNWVPDLQDYSIKWTDKILIEKFNLSKEEWEIINNKIR